MGGQLSDILNKGCIGVCLQSSKGPMCTYTFSRSMRICVATKVHASNSCDLVPFGYVVARLTPYLIYDCCSRNLFSSGALQITSNGGTSYTVSFRSKRYSVKGGSRCHFFLFANYKYSWEAKYVFCFQWERSSMNFAPVQNVLHRFTFDLFAARVQIRTLD